ncbi:hypothetical protein MA16_Dca014412 [Dendrobium catenatum]|uniref:Uncharacterized protein n=1 Tax=Dendrobium catenatum TaxID=906689 RepID=A0A2I0WWK6_9ASPA|nr:hypothetical protein MA16_Dca014412 [Dendrobium catenatum]
MTSPTSSTPVVPPILTGKTRSFKDVVSSGSSSSASKVQFVHAPFKGCPDLLFDDAVVQQLAAPFSFTLVGLFCRFLELRASFVQDFCVILLSRELRLLVAPSSSNLWGISMEPVPGKYQGPPNSDVGERRFSLDEEEKISFPIIQRCCVS